MNSPAASLLARFDHPIAMLDQCHQRIRRNCDLIVRIARQVRAGGVDERMQGNALAVVRFFDTAGAYHHRDEEDDLFPALIHFAPSLELNAVRCLVFKLRAQHAQLDAMWVALRPQVIAAGTGRESELAVEVAQSFAAATEGHVASEEAELLPLARRVLGERPLARMGYSMARRRGLVPQAA
jgi:hemerythrin-like domain-containing protein